MPEIIYNRINKNYNATRTADPYIAGRLLEFLRGKQPRQDNRPFLDIGCGTGNYTMALAREIAICGVDPSEKMLEEARSNGPELSWQLGSAEQVPAADGHFAGAIATLTVHHWQDIPRAMAELCRVLAAGGRLVVFTSTPEQMQGYWLHHYFPGMMQASIQQMPDAARVTEAAITAGFTPVAKELYVVRPDQQDHFLYTGKERPELYFDNSIRNGISSFAALAHAEEVGNGLAQLRRDLDTGAFAAIKQQYRHDKGDYLFLVFEKK
jgi:SAM-dependent methyltransferase